MTPQEPVDVGDLMTLETGPVAHGGHVVARVGGPGGQVVFVRLALPGERVRVRITEGGRFLRGDAVEVREASPHRVAAPCPLARPDGCGGYDFQHVALDEQRRLKAAVVREQLQRLAGLDRDVVCEAVPGDEDGLRWRTRMQYVELPGGRRGLRKHRSHDVVEVTDCLIARPDAQPHSPPSRTVTEEVDGRSFRVAADGPRAHGDRDGAFWQVHPGAPTVLVETVLGQLGARPGERALDLYAGVGLFARFLAEEVGPSGHVLAVESDRTATPYAVENLTGLGQAEVFADRVDRWVRRAARQGLRTDLVVLDPPRAGAKRAVVEDVAALRPRRVSYVACDPAALARDLAYFGAAGYRLADLRCLDLFPMTHHVECVALLEPVGA
jgi:tRNA/tmRNA/rRNA uracil-C5-methylase (TrmA/RlmC/RlmD family)